MHSWNQSVKLALEPLANAENASFMKAYMRGQYQFFGIQSMPRRTALKPLFAKEQLPSFDEIPDVIDELWASPEREFQLVAVDLLIKLKQQLPLAMLKDLERWITTKSWWDTVDMLATHILASFYRRFPEETSEVIGRWRLSDNIWLRRSTLLYQLKFKQETDKDLLFELIRENRSDKEFFIQKAIGWMLREYSKTDAESVVRFIEIEKIDGLAKREGLKWLKSKKLI
ncbi:DNA alkylation repair protein [Vibrio methylphosphonaticus]|uniref:DNA alkylation repair protein n=1 Tax=Vibrio methylphosphonaticus TaxID=2946866 RepID=UPI00202A88FA|nr:DNA alkylation repair protein [Vibrio methylphosphonaticus]MCL9775666.1 DNA alkylation repair protein [Vibrio methylphosphonaticus]